MSAVAAPPRDFDRPRFLPWFTGVFYLFLFAPIALVVLFSFNSAKSLQKSACGASQKSPDALGTSDFGRIADRARAATDFEF